MGGPEYVGQPASAPSRGDEVYWALAATTHAADGRPRRGRHRAVGDRVNGRTCPMGKCCWTWMLTALIATAACRGSDDAVPWRSPIGRLFPQTHATYVGMPVADSTQPGGRCRVITVTHARCGISKALAQGWVDDLRDTIALAGRDASFSWLVFGDRAELGELFRWLDGEPPPTWLVEGSPSDVERFMGLSGYPHTFVVGGDTIRAVIAGNRLPSTLDLLHGCSAQ
jgi:hypothetical protein